MRAVSAGLPPKPLLTDSFARAAASILAWSLSVHGIANQDAGRELHGVRARSEPGQPARKLSGRGRILISEATYEHFCAMIRQLAATCVQLPAATLKGIRSAVQVYEVPWRTDGPQPPVRRFSRRASPAFSGYDSDLTRRT